MRFQVQYIVGQVFGGSEVLSLRAEHPPSSNAPVWYVGFACRKCGIETESSSSACTQWTAKRLPWRCAACRASDRKDAAAESRTLADTLETQTVRNLVLLSDGAKRYYQGEASCIHCNKPVVGKIRSLRMLERQGGIRCATCRGVKAATGGALSTSRSKGGILPAQTLRALDALPLRVRQIAERSIREHLGACIRSGIPVDDLNRVYIEAIEVAKLEAKMPTVLAAPSEPFCRYGQYAAPKDAWIN